MASLLTRLSDQFSARTASSPWTLTSLAATTAIFTLFTAAYQDWRRLGPGGLPFSLRGFLTCLYVQATRARSDTTSVSPYAAVPLSAPGWADASDAERVAARESFLPASAQDLPIRRGPRSKARFWVIPQREFSAQQGREAARGEIGKAYLAAFDRLAEEFADVVEWRTSVLEKRGRALFLRSGFAPPGLAAGTHGEIAHLHTSDHSGHVTLSFADAEQVVGKGWAERHRLSGNMLPLGYTMTYFPRTLEEIEVYINIFRAGIGYMRGGK